MRISTAVLLSGTAIGRAVAGINVTRLHQSAKHQWERVKVALAQNQLDWLERVSTDPTVAAHWKPAGMKTEEYMKLMSANRRLCRFGLRNRLGFVTEHQLDLYASLIMASPTARRYWKELGHLRVQEAGTNPRAVRFNAALARAAASLADHQGGPVSS
ncbi:MULTISPECIES: DUF6082 family protein [unclassified Streptomyces]|uniref:DUF6082 family protein n=1 Tax=unclassified Streptomyces TaxID=2593676 RepID=UPI00339DEBEF